MTQRQRELIALGFKCINDAEHPHVGDAALFLHLAQSYFVEAGIKSAAEVKLPPLSKQWREWLIDKQK